MFSNEEDGSERERERGSASEKMADYVRFFTEEDLSVARKLTGVHHSLCPLLTATVLKKSGVVKKLLKDNLTPHQHGQELTALTWTVTTRNLKILDIFIRHAIKRDTCLLVDIRDAICTAVDWTEAFYCAFWKFVHAKIYFTTLFPDDDVNRLYRKACGHRWFYLGRVLAETGMLKNYEPMVSCWKKPLPTVVAVDDEFPELGRTKKVRKVVQEEASNDELSMVTFRASVGRLVEVMRRYEREEDSFRYISPFWTIGDEHGFVQGPCVTVGQQVHYMRATWFRLDLLSLFRKLLASMPSLDIVRDIDEMIEKYEVEEESETWHYSIIWKETDEPTVNGSNMKDIIGGIEKIIEGDDKRYGEKKISKKVSMTKKFKRRKSVKNRARRNDNGPKTVSRWTQVLKDIKPSTTYYDEIQARVSADDTFGIVGSLGNFGTVRIGLDVHNNPIIIKRLHVDGQSIYATVKGLIGVTHRNVVPYLDCALTNESYLLVTTPLCEFNVGEYVCLKAKQDMSVVTKVFTHHLLLGLKFLHMVPVVHGNLKPSNVLIDLYGVVKLADFGVYKVLYQARPPPTSSVIWFSQETYRSYERDKHMSCTVRSDVQVAGMLLYFLRSGGSHPFGATTDAILENMSHDVAVDLDFSQNRDFKDLVERMLNEEPSNRPTVHQALCHVYFWDASKKWNFLLACCGVDPRGTPLTIDLNDLYERLATLSVYAKVESDWKTVMQVLLPGLEHLDCKSFGNTTVGFLKFLRACVDEYRLCSYDVTRSIELREFVLEWFPSLPLTLFRLLESTEWMECPVFARFNVVSAGN